MEIQDQLDEIFVKINDKNFYKNLNKVNQDNIAVFDYNPLYEMEVRTYVNNLKKEFENNTNVDIIECDLFEILIEILDSNNYLDEIFQLEENKNQNVIKTLLEGLLFSNNSNLLIENINTKINEKSSKNVYTIIFITGFGKVYPFIRSYHLVGSLNDYLDNFPIIIFYPGKFKTKGLFLFNDIDDGSFSHVSKLIRGF